MVGKEKDCIIREVRRRSGIIEPEAPAWQAEILPLNQ